MRISLPETTAFRRATRESWACSESGAECFTLILFDREGGHAWIDTCGWAARVDKPTRGMTMYR